MPMPDARRYDLIVFDWDGTLMDSTAGIVLSMQHAFREHGLPQPERSAVRQVIGLGMDEALQQLAPLLPVDERIPLGQSFRAAWPIYGRQAALYEGAHALLGTLQQAGYTLAVATGMSRRGLEQALDQTGLRPFFAATRCAEESFSKPHPAMLLELLDELFHPADRALMVGDTTHDLQMAANAGVEAVALTQGAHDAAQLALVPHRVMLANLAELAGWLES